ncbi:MAG: chromosome segregation protein SMC [Bacteriovoracia bacterium]
MRVKRLEIQGFKSFKDKTVIHFDQAITGIVGPNGCGKSNIVDAFFWVMGEQSYKHIRGSGSDDLIFNGSSKYTPLGVAEATMVLETDYVDTETAPAGATTQDIPLHLRSKEISVTRRVYRGGEGEYLINGVTARLKDIQELFMDTGVGAKGYSVIEQGQIGRIVNAKPEERRRLVEEAAGIAKYKARKKESLRKMEAAQANLSRLKDVLSEIDRNLGSLERQASKARRYNEHKKELLDKEMTWGRRKKKIFAQQIEAVKLERQQLEEEIFSLRTELQTAETQLEADRASLLTDTKQAEDLQTFIQKVAGELTQEQTTLELSRRRQDDLAAQIQSLTTEKAELERSVETDRGQIAAREEALVAGEAELASATSEMSELDSRLAQIRTANDSVRKELEAIRVQLMSSMNQSAELKSKQAGLDAKNEVCEQQIVRVREQKTQTDQRLNDAQSHLEQQSALKGELSERRYEVSRQFEESLGEMQRLKAQTAELEAARDENHEKLTRAESKLQSLEELVANYEGLTDGPKHALEWAKQNGRAAHFQLLADLFEVSAEHEKALEGWLENKIENLVTNDAQAVVELLREMSRSDLQTRGGRVSIRVAPPSASMLRSSVSTQEATQRLEAHGFRVVGALDNLVRVKAEGLSDNVLVGAQVSALIAKVLIVESLEPVSAALAANQPLDLDGWALVAQTGEVLEADGTLRVGALQAADSSTLLARRRIIQELRQQLQEMSDRETEYAAKLEGVTTELLGAEETNRSAQMERQSLEVKLAAVERDVEQSTRMASEIEAQLRSIDGENQRLASEIEAIAGEKVNIADRLAGLADEVTRMEAMAKEKSSGIDQQNEALQLEEGRLQELRVKVASLRERALSVKREVEVTRSYIAERESRVREISQLLDRVSKEREQFAGNDGAVNDKIESLTIEVAERREALALMKDKIEQCRARENSALDRIKELHKTGDQKSHRTTELSIDLERLSGELSHLVQNLEEKYGPGCLEQAAVSPIQEEMTDPVVTQEMTAEEETQLFQEVEELRDKIRRMGEVNPMAVEEYEELKKRFDYLDVERVDLETSIQNLEEAIDHINKTSEDRFKKAFEAIANRFERLFPVIFGGGRAELSLVYPEGSTDILEAGVDILAQPPGKKIVNIGLLSGGEKALTAVSLIFAIFMVKPSPFCILDEVDAPLDDANIGKFNALLKEMAGNTQFILITHNKKTMELNDTLYGVTMEEPGVSKMISIQLS